MQNNSIGNTFEHLEATTMKAKIYFGVSLATTAAGCLLMAALLYSEGHLGNSKFHSEFLAGGSIFGAFGIIMGAVTAKAYARWGSEMGNSPKNRGQLWLMAVFVFGVLLSTFIGSLYLLPGLGLLTREQTPPVALLLALSVGWLLVQREPEVFVAAAPKPELSPEANREEIFQRMLSEGDWTEDEKRELRRGFDISNS